MTAHFRNTWETRCVPNVAFYQAEPRPDGIFIIILIVFPMNQWGVAGLSEADSQNGL